ncbi:nucleolar and spindle-associated protein 1 isoform X3 [Pteropus vampyrus]|uniref:Nucleolar and spindle-associated protein 1 isoform X3 n=1 Tax=Pteropus vampyrus TaxID=132908 RepID=A0A6P6C8X1_PTEVA|nr:nucleolar and spindle-associated protein 1 isoform X3 [Pteropus vampyrus]
MTVPSVEELDSFKYSDLQSLAKSLGLRANLKADKLLKALKAHLKQEARKENENQYENQISASSYDETEIQMSSQEQAERELAGHVTKKRRKRRTVHRIPDSQDHSEIKTRDPTEFRHQEKQENQELRTAAEVPSPLVESQEDANAVCSGKSGINGNEDSKVPLERKKSLYTDGFSKSGKNKRTASTTPNFKKLHEARFKEMESIDQYIERKKKHFEQHNLLNEKKQLVTKGVVATPVCLQERFSVACTPTSQRHPKAQGAAGRNTSCVKGSVKRSTLSATKMNVRFSATTKDNEHKRSLTKTPARKSPHVTIAGSTPKGQAVLGTQKLKTTKGDSVAVITPLRLTADATKTPVSHRKPVFDLKASLSRPLNYEPHKGKLKPWGQSKENKSLNEHVNRVSFHKKMYKQPRLQAREEQRKKHVQERKEKKAKVLEARRGLIMAAD